MPEPDNVILIGGPYDRRTAWLPSPAPPTWALPALVNQGSPQITEHADYPAPPPPPLLYHRVTPSNSSQHIYVHYSSDAYQVGGYSLPDRMTRVMTDFILRTTLGEPPS